MRKFCLLLVISVLLTSACTKNSSPASAGAAANPLFTVETYPSPEELLRLWNFNLGAPLQVKKFHRVDDEVMMGTTANGLSLAYNARNQAYGVIGAFDKQTLGIACVALYSMFLKTTNEGFDVWNHLIPEFASQNMASAYNDGIQFRIFQMPNDPNATCNVAPAPRQPDTEISWNRSRAPSSPSKAATPETPSTATPEVASAPNRCEAALAEQEAAIRRRDQSFGPDLIGATQELIAISIRVDQMGCSNANGNTGSDSGGSDRSSALSGIADEETADSAEAAASASEHSSQRSANALYSVALKDAITRQWTRPASVPSGVPCQLRVLQSPGGEVVDVNVSSGCPYDEAGKRSLEAAVLKASPLPYAGFEDVFRRDVILTIRPEDDDGLVYREASISQRTPPRYPSEEQRRGITGTTTLVLAIDAEGNVSDAQVAQSSGNGNLDAAAIQAAMNWTASPQIENGRPVPSTLRVPVTFSLN